jgi:hypothetical protein
MCFPHTIDVMAEKAGKLRGDIGAIRKVLTLSFRNPDHCPPRNAPFSQEMHSKIQLSSQGSKSPNSKPGCRVLGLHFFAK